ncbi:MAG: UDP-N-acetylmuramate dehydrogenase [PVC group bacterium]
MSKDIQSILSNVQCQDATPGEEMRKHTSLAIGGPVEIFIIPADRDNLIRCLDLLSERNLSFRILGGGTNLLADDRGVEGVVIKPKWRPEDLAFQGTRVTAPAGMALTRLAQAAAERGLSGLEFAAGIPGTVGGAAVMNAGWRGEEVSGVVRRVRVHQPCVGEREMKADQCRFGYRSSRFQKEGGVILEVEFSLCPGDPVAIQSEMKDVLSQRKKFLPLEYPSAGSVFKNPAGDYAGRLIEAAGLKGKRIGDAQISDKHANIIVNRGSARFAEVEELIQLARRKVKDRSGIDLELELIIWR